MDPKSRGMNSDSDIDDAYKIFLDHAREDGYSYAFEMSPVYVKYEEEDEPSIKTEEPELHGGSLIPFDTFNPVFENDVTSIGTSKSSNLSYYEKGLMFLCDKPFDHSEYEDLFHMVSAHEPKMGERRLRGGTKTYRTKETAKSYFDYHPDF